MPVDDNDPMVQAFGNAILAGDSLAPQAFRDWLLERDDDRAECFVDGSMWPEEFALMHFALFRSRILDDLVSKISSQYGEK